MGRGKRKEKRTHKKCSESAPQKVGKPYLPPNSFLCGPYFFWQRKVLAEQGGVWFLRTFDHDKGHNLQFRGAVSTGFLLNFLQQISLFSPGCLRLVFPGGEKSVQSRHVSGCHGFLFLSFVFPAKPAQNASDKSFLNPLDSWASTFSCPDVRTKFIYCRALRALIMVGFMAWYHSKVPVKVPVATSRENAHELFCTNFLNTPKGPGLPGKIPGTSQIPLVKTQGRQTFEGGHRLFGHHPFAWTADPKSQSLCFLLA